MARKTATPRSRSKATPQSRSAARRSAAREPLFRAYLAMSLDGYIADPAGEVGWLDPYFSPELDFAAFFKTIGATVMGRATWDWMVEHKHPLETEGPCIVQTRRPLGKVPAGVEAYAGDVRKLARRLRAELRGTDKDVWLMGGGQSLDTFREHGLIDRWELAVIPVLMGDGIPLFPRHARGLESLRLTHSRVLSNGIIEVRYEPARAGK